MSIEAFRTEIIETQKARSDLLKWKLVITAALGAVGLGVTNSSKPNSSVDVDLALCLIPFVCAYVDLLCYHLNLRMFVINKFFKRIKVTDGLNLQDELLRSVRIIHDYEETCGEVRSAFELESSALKWSSIVLSLLVIAYSYYANTRINAAWFFLAGILGVIMACLSERVYEKKATDLTNKELTKIDLAEPYSKTSSSSFSAKRKLQNSLVSLESLESLEKKLNLLVIFCFIFSISLFLVGTWLIVIYLLINLKSKSCGSWDQYPGEAVLLILPGILCIFSSTLIENFFRKTIEWKKENFKDPKNNLSSWLLFLLSCLLVPIIGIYLWNRGFFLSNIHVCIDDSSKNMINLAIQTIGPSLMVAGILVPLILLAFANNTLENLKKIS